MSFRDRHIAALDLGSNSFHMIIAKIVGNEIAIVHREKYRMRMKDIGDDQDGVISLKKMKDAIELLKLFKIKAEKYSASILAVATSSIRESKNHKEFIDKVFSDTGIKVTIVSGDEEAELALLSLKYYMKELPGRYMLFDLGGGSTEFIFVENAKIIKKFSLPIGAVRLTNRFPLVNNNDIASITALKQYVKNELREMSNYFSVFNCEKIYGMGGTVSAVCVLVEMNIFKRIVEYAQLRNYVIDISGINQIYEIVLNSKSLDEKKIIPGVEVTRADIISAGVIILKTFFEEMKLTSITFGWSGLREGIIIDTISKEAI